MTWKICCNNIGEQTTTFQSFLNILKIREMSGQKVKENNILFYYTDLNLGSTEVYWRISGFKRTKIGTKDKIH